MKELGEINHPTVMPCITIRSILKVQLFFYKLLISLTLLELSQTQTRIINI